MNIFKSFLFYLPKKGSRSRPKKVGSGSSSNFKLAPAPAKKTSASTGSATLDKMFLTPVFHYSNLSEPHIYRFRG